MKNTFLTCALVILACGGTLRADWGDLKLKFVLDGNAPALKPLAADKDAAVCGKKPIPDETLVVGANGELANVLVYLVPEKGAKLEIHADYEKDKNAKVVLDNKGCQFFPHIATLRTGQVLELKIPTPSATIRRLIFSPTHR